MWDLNLGIWMVIRDPTPIVRQKSTRKLMSMTEYGKYKSAARIHYKAAYYDRGHILFCKLLKVHYAMQIAGK
jgi:hypothetical protein